MSSRATPFNPLVHTDVIEKLKSHLQRAAEHYERYGFDAQSKEYRTVLSVAKYLEATVIASNERYARAVECGKKLENRMLHELNKHKAERVELRNLLVSQAEESALLKRHMIRILTLTGHGVTTQAQAAYEPGPEPASNTGIQGSTTSTASTAPAVPEVESELLVSAGIQPEADDHHDSIQVPAEAATVTVTASDPGPGIFKLRTASRSRVTTLSTMSSLKPLAVAANGTPTESLGADVSAHSVPVACTI